MNNVSEFRMEWFKEFFESVEDKENRNINRIKYPIDGSMCNRAINLQSLSDTNTTKGFYAYFVNNDIQMAKQYFYLTARLLSESCQYPCGWDMWTPHKFIFALLSDNAELIDIYSKLDTVNNDRNFGDNQRPPLSQSYHLPREGRFDTLLMQHLLRRDWATIGQMNHTYQTKMKKVNGYDRDTFLFYFALRDGDVDGMTGIIKNYLKTRTHQSLNKHLVMEFCGEFWSHRPTIFTKLAWMFGYEIHIEHDLVPMSLIVLVTTKSDTRTCKKEHYPF